MSKQPVYPPNAPKPVGPYSPAIVANGFVFVAGQGPIVPETGKLVTGGIQEQTRQTLENIKSILETAGSGMDKVVKCNVFLADIRDFSAMNEIYGTYFPDPKPARTTVQAGALPLQNMLVEIEAVALA